jgi:hypothetical protein
MRGRSRHWRGPSRLAGQKAWGEKGASGGGGKDGGKTCCDPVDYGRGRGREHLDGEGVPLPGSEACLAVLGLAQDAGDELGVPSPL